MRKGRLYGLTGFLSVLGFIGVFTQERTFLAFFAFAVDFQYFFIRSDEMMEQMMDRIAAWGFYSGMAATAAAALGGMLLGSRGAEALAAAFAVGWAAAVLVHGVLTAAYSFREGWGMDHDS